METYINSLSQKCFSQSPKEIFQIVDKGHVNLVYKVTFPDVIYILRLSKDTSGLRTYTKEKWCMEKATEKGVPTAKCIALGIFEDRAYSFQTYIEGKDGSDRPDIQDTIWFTLGKYANIINQIKVKGYGENLKYPEKDDFGNDWEDMLDWTMDYLFKNNFFINEGILNAIEIEKIKTRLSEQYTWKFEPVLCHSNLGPKNTVVHPDGTIYVIDWGTAMSHRAPHLELSEVLTWDYGKKVEDLFKQGYGIDEKQFNEIAHDVETLVLLRMLDSIKWAAENKKDWRNVDFVRNSIKKLKSMLI